MDAQSLFISSQQTKRHVISVTGEPSMAHGVLSMAISAGCIRWVYSNFGVFSLSTPARQLLFHKFWQKRSDGG